MPLFIVENDITKMDTECIVISADVSLKPTGGMSTEFYNAVKEPKNLIKECERIGFCGGCECVTTHSYGLPCKYVIHAVAPIFADSKNKAEEYLLTCYKNAIYMARRKMFESLAIPLLGTGKKGYSKEMSLRLALQAITEYLSKYDMSIYLVVHNKSSFKPDVKFISSVESYLSKNYTGNGLQGFESVSTYANSYIYDVCTDSAVNYIGAECRTMLNDKEQNIKNESVDIVNFPAVLKNVLKKYSVKFGKIYRSANIEKFAFERLKSNEDKTPDKEVVLALAVALQMSINTAEQFCTESGYSLTHNKQDAIVRYFLENKIYNIHMVNQMLFYFGEAQLGTLI